MAQLKAQKVTATAVTFAAPDKVTVTVGGKPIVGHLIVTNGALQVVIAAPKPVALTLIAAGNGNPIRLKSVAVGSSTVTLVGTMDLQSLLGL